MFKKILIPIDGSEAALNAVRVAKSIAEKYGSQEIILLHVIAIEYISQERHFPSPEGVEMPHPYDFEELFKNAKEVFNNNGIKINLRLEHGFAWNSIVNTANEEHVDLIVIGNRGLSGIKSFFLGSVCKQVVNDVHCTILVVK